ncbi:serine/threonine-protein kinase [Spirillospora sp. CA-128828]|uniref:serine/threonine-protein kinase n=1 Tax=Spirillospora sp. CA-128828 TaxID=3240033 RepID=UPI003D8BFEE0
MGRHGRAAEASVVLAGRYRLIEPVGRGGMAEVWAAEDAALRRMVAVKLLDPAPAPDQPASTTRADVMGTVSERVWREARGAARLVHPNVVRIYDVATDGDRMFLVMELVTGPNLAEILHRQGPRPPAQVAALGAQTARALAAAHDADLVHGDVKPGNLLLADDGTLKLTDFGIASPMDTPAPTQATGQTAGLIIGTAGYLAPELAHRFPPSPAGDLYALGCMLYELCTGQPPFTADTQVDVLQRHMHDAPVPPARLCPDVPVELEQAILRLLAKDPAARPADATRVAEALELISRISRDNATVDEPTTATQILPPLAPTGRHARTAEQPSPSPGQPPSPVSWSAHHPLLTAALGALIVAVIALAIIAITRSGDRRTAPPPPAGSPTAQRSNPTALLKPR